MRYKVIDWERFITCLMVLVILIGLYVAIGTIERRHDIQIEQRAWIERRCESETVWLHSED